MCRYAISGPYKDRFACFHCRKAFKRRKVVDLPPSMRGGAEGAKPVLCPDCRRAMHDMGMDFEAPPKQDVRQWTKVELLFQNGFTFHSCGCGPGLMPAELREVQAFLSETLPKTDAQRLLETIRNRRAEQVRRQRGNLAPKLSGRTWGREVAPRRKVQLKAGSKGAVASQFRAPRRKRVAGP
jgi:hypothetical protein